MSGLILGVINPSILAAQGYFCSFCFNLSWLRGVVAETKLLSPVFSLIANSCMIIVKISGFGLGFGRVWNSLFTRVSMVRDRHPVFLVQLDLPHWLTARYPLVPRQNVGESCNAEIQCLFFSFLAITTITCQ